MEFVRTNVLRMAEAELMDNENQIRTMRAVANYLSSLVPLQRIDNRAMADSQVNSAVVITGLPYYSPEVDCLRDIMTLGGILNEGHFGVHYCQLNKNHEGRATGTAFVGWVNPALANACIALFEGYQGPRGTVIQVTANETGNPFHQSNSRVIGNPRCDNEVWDFPDPRTQENMSIQGQSFGAPTFVWNWREIVNTGLLRI